MRLRKINLVGKTVLVNLEQIAFMTSNNGPNSWRRALYSPPNGSKSGQK